MFPQALKKLFTWTVKNDVTVLLPTTWWQKRVSFTERNT